MATIGLKDIYFAPILEDGENGTTYDDPIKIGRAIQANVQPQTNTADLRADDAVAETAESRGPIVVSVGVDDLDKEAQATLFGMGINKDGVLVDNINDRAPYGALMFRSEKANGYYRYVVLYKGKFTLPEEDYETKQETPAFQTPTVEGRFISRRSDGAYRSIVDEDDDDVDESIIDRWFEAPYEPSGNDGNVGGVEG